MSWRVEWKALSDRILGLLDAALFYLKTQSISTTDSYAVAKNQLLPQAKDIFQDLNNFLVNNKSNLPSEAASYLQNFIDNTKSKFENGGMEVHATIQFRVSSLSSLRSEFTYHISDSTTIAKRLSERAFLHLQRIIVVDSCEREKWTRAYEEGERSCEKLGAVHLLLHGIWAFKINATGERTDLVFGDPISDFEEIERSSEVLVLTEWKKMPSGSSQSTVISKATEARKQAARYASGSLGGLELAQYRYIILVSEKVLSMPPDDHDSDIIYRYINIAVNPSPPSEA